MITPDYLKQMEINNDFVNPIELEQEIDSCIIRTHGTYPWEIAVITGEYSIGARNMICERYKKFGWKFVYHRSSLENGEIPGLTSFIFSNEELCDEYVKGYHKV